MAHTKRCSACGSDAVEETTRVAAFVYRGRAIRFNQFGEWCNDCGDVVLNGKEDRKSKRIISDFQAEIDGRLTTTEIRRIRQKLGLSRREAGEQIAGSRNSFVGFESGRRYPDRATENILRILDRHPTLLRELRDEVNRTPRRINEDP